MVRRIVVSTNCQTGGLAAALQVLFPNDEILARPMPDEHDSDGATRLADDLDDAAIWVRFRDHRPVTNRPENASRFAHVTCADIPHFNFSAFHPDVCYAFDKKSGEITKRHGNSRIVVWSYRNGVSVDRAVALFAAPVLADLGYMDYWATSVEPLRAVFEICELDFVRFFLKVKRGGVFMHTPNHPKIDALAALARVVALRLGQPDSVIEMPIDVPDGLLALDTWPAYPPIAHAFSLPSAWLWKQGNRIYDLAGYVAFAYGNYEQQGIAPEELTFARGSGDIDRLDATLRRHLS